MMDSRTYRKKPKAKSGRMTYQNRQAPRAGTDPANRRSEVARLAREGVYHYEIARRLGVSESTINSEMKVLRATGDFGSMRGPRARSAGVDWSRARETWFDARITLDDAVAEIGCAERTIYRRLGPRGGPSAGPVWKRIRRTKTTRSIDGPSNAETAEHEHIAEAETRLETTPTKSADDVTETETFPATESATIPTQVEAAASEAGANDVARTPPAATRTAPAAVRRFYYVPTPCPRNATAPPQPTAPTPKPRPTPFGMSCLQGPDPLAEIKLAAMRQASKGRL